MMNSFETGPIRPPSEAGSYLIRLTRGCPWNRCEFCTTYREEKFSIREEKEVMANIDAMAAIRDDFTKGGMLRRPRDRYEYMVAGALANGGRTVFLQDGDSLAMKPDAVRRVLSHLREKFPEVERITTYARSRTLSNRKVEDLISYRELGLTRIHIGMETAHDPLLGAVKKGVDFDTHVRAGRMVVEAGIELSEYVMPGLGGRQMSRGHAADTARALSLIDPHFIRFRTLCLGPGMGLWELFSSGGLTRLSDVEIVAEIRDFVAALEVTRTRIASDHILNLLGELEGRLPQDKERLLAICDKFLSLDPAEQLLFQVGRRAGLMDELSDLEDPSLRRRAGVARDQFAASRDDGDVEEALRELASRFV